MRERHFFFVLHWCRWEVQMEKDVGWNHHHCTGHWPIVSGIAWHAFSHPGLYACCIPYAAPVLNIHLDLCTKSRSRDVSDVKW